MANETDSGSREEGKQNIAEGRFGPICRFACQPNCRLRRYDKRL